MKHLELSVNTGGGSVSQRDFTEEIGRAGEEPGAALGRFTPALVTPAVLTPPALPTTSLTFRHQPLSPPNLKLGTKTVTALKALLKGPDGFSSTSQDNHVLGISHGPITAARRGTVRGT